MRLIALDQNLIVLMKLCTKLAKAKTAQDKEFIFIYINQLLKTNKLKGGQQSAY